LEVQAIQAAKTAQWSSAISLNQLILEQAPDDTGALNRLGVAHAQLFQNKRW
jgi:Flp pilus assembly protein TadD